MMLKVLIITATSLLILCKCLPFLKCEKSKILENNSTMEKEWARVVVDAVNEDTTFTRGNYWKLYAVDKVATLKKTCKTKAVFDVVVAETECLRPRIITPKTDSHCPYNKNPKAVRANITVKEKNGKPIKVKMTSPLVIVVKVPPLTAK